MPIFVIFNAKTADEAYISYYLHLKKLDILKNELKYSICLAIYLSMYLRTVDPPPRPKWRGPTGLEPPP